MSNEGSPWDLLDQRDDEIENLTSEISSLKDSAKYDSFLREKYRNIIKEFIEAFEKASAKSAAWDGNRILLQKARELIK